MNKGTSIAFLVVGVLLLAFGINAYHSLGSNVTEAVNGAPSNKAIWLLAAGIILGLAGLFGTIRRPAALN